MALINCPECNREISDKAVSCPHCGFPLNGVENTTKENLNPSNMCVVGCRNRDLSKEMQMINDGIYSGAVVSSLRLRCDLTLEDARGLESVMRANGYVPTSYGATVQSMQPIASSARAAAIPTSNQPKCPTCGSINLKKVSAASKVGSVAMFGLLSQKVKKTWHCNNCGHEW